MDRESIFVIRVRADEWNTELVGTFVRIVSATYFRNTEAIALPGMLYASSLGSSDGLKPVFTMPVLLLGLMCPPASSLASR